jgi:hypothetical protein
MFMYRDRFGKLVEGVEEWKLARLPAFRAFFWYGSATLLALVVYSGLVPASTRRKDIYVD